MAGADIEECIDECLACGAVCEDAARWCRRQGGEFASRARIGVLVTCAAFARLIADYLREDAELTPAAVDLFTDVCDRVVVACEPLADAAPLLRACVERCTECRERVREVFALAELA